MSYLWTVRTELPLGRDGRCASVLTIIMHLRRPGRHGEPVASVQPGGTAELITTSNTRLPKFVNAMSAKVLRGVVYSASHMHLKF
mmetsp:Transcript_50565/g.131562  ORF Transcript_50565/g.131562 Transcript_50565/m.131562 type:complete len:85 (-) Transcript_50565:857-1111(-)